MLPESSANCLIFRVAGGSGCSDYTRELVPGVSLFLMLRLCVPVQAFFYPHAEHSGQEVVANPMTDELRPISRQTTRSKGSCLQ